MRISRRQLFPNTTRHYLQNFDHRQDRGASRANETILFLFFFFAYEHAQEAGM